MTDLRNRVTLIGHAGKDPEFREFGKDSRLATFSLATNETYKNAKGERVTETQWHNIAVWGKTADFAKQYIKKGSYLVVDGKIVNRSYETKEGEKRYITEIVANQLSFLSTKNQESAA